MWRFALALPMALFMCVWCFRAGRKYHLAGLAWILLTVAVILNGTAIWANGGRMPVKWPHAAVSISDASHVAITPESRLIWLTDIHGNRWVRYSLGDGLCGVAIVLWLVAIFRRYK
jgi:hypothetical protein